VTKIEAVANTYIKLSGDIDSLKGVLDGPITALTGDTVVFDNITVNTPLDDSIFYDKFSSNLSGTQYSLVLGGHMELPIVKLGMSMELGMPYKLSGYYNNNAGLPVGQPELQNVDVSTLNFSGDSLTGSIGLDIGGVEYNKKTAVDSGAIELPGMTSLKASLGLKFWGLRVGVNGGMDMLTTEWPAIGNAYASVGTSLSIKRTSLKLGLASRWQYLALEKDKLYSSAPMVILGAGLGIPFPKGELMLGSRINLANGILSASNLKKMEDFNPLETIALNAGIRISI